MCIRDRTYQMYPLAQDRKNYAIFIPIDYHSPKQNETLQVYYTKNKENFEEVLFVTVVDGDYKQNEIITVPKSQVTLSLKNKEKTADEYALVYGKVYSKITPKDLTSKTPFILPLQSKITSEYGNARVYNNTVKSYHIGVAFQAKIGDPIVATNNGKVVLVMERFYLGQVIYLDHGWGAYSYYAHLSEVLVQEGDYVKRGDIIAKSGNTGRVTGPHLHYALRLHNTTVDPLQYGELYNSFLLENL